MEISLKVFALLGWHGSVSSTLSGRVFFPLLVEPPRAITLISFYFLLLFLPSRFKETIKTTPRRVMHFELHLFYTLSKVSQVLYISNRKLVLHSQITGCNILFCCSSTNFLLFFQILHNIDVKKGKNVCKIAAIAQEFNTL